MKRKSFVLFLLSFVVIAIPNQVFSHEFDRNNVQDADHPFINGYTNQVFGDKSIVIGNGNLAGWKTGAHLPDLDKFALNPDDDFQFQVGDLTAYSITKRHHQMSVVGFNNGALGEKSTAIGSNNLALGSSAVSVGKANLAKGGASQAIGDFNSSNAFKASAIGYRNVINDQGNYSSAFGGFNYITNWQSFAFGGLNKIFAPLSSAFGFGNIIHNQSKYSTVGGVQNVVNGLNAVVYGTKNSVSGASNLAIGVGNDITAQNSIVIGNSKITDNVQPRSELAGPPVNTQLSKRDYNRVSGEYGIVIGHNNNLQSNNTILIGNNINASDIHNSIVLGERSVGAIWGEDITSLVINQFGESQTGLIINLDQNARYSSSNGTLSVGAPGHERRIKNVAPGLISSISTDVVTGSQLYAVIQSIGNVPIYIRGDYGEQLRKKLGGTISINGGAANYEELTDNNIGVIIEGGAAKIKLSKNLSYLKRLFFEGGNVLSEDGLTLNNGLKFNSEGITMGNLKVDSITRRISGVEDPIDLQDVVNLRYLQNTFSLFPKRLEFEANSIESYSIPLDGKVKISGSRGNLDINNFDGGKNIFTHIVKDNNGVSYTIALRKSPDFESLTLSGSKSKGITGFISIPDLKGEEKVEAYIDVDNNGNITVTGRDEDQYTDVMHDGLEINDGSGYSKLGAKEEGNGDVVSANLTKRRLTHTFEVEGKINEEEIATLNDGFIFSGNLHENSSIRLNSKVKIAGADANTNWSDFDEGQNIMTKVENVNGETVIRIAMRKNLKLKNGDIGGDGTKGELNIKQEDGSTGLTLNPDKILFNNITKLDENGQVQKNGSAGISMTQNGKSDLVKEGPATRILITDSKGEPISQVATMNDGLKFGANSGDEVSNLLNSKVIVAGNKQNNDWTEFDEGKNIMTKVEQSKGNTDITIALKRDIELDSATFGRGATTEQNGVKPKEGKDGRIKLVNKNGKTAIQIDAGKTTDFNGPSISINKPDSEEGTKLTSEGFEIRKKSHVIKDSEKSITQTKKAFVSIATEGSARIEQDVSARRTRLTLKSGEVESAITEEIATMNDGLRFKGDSEELINKTLSSTLSIVGGETDATKLTSSKEDKNIGVIVEDAPNASKDTNTKPQKVLAVRLSKKIKGLQSAEFKPVDENSKPTGQTITIGKEGLTISNKDKRSQFNEEGLKIGENGPSVTDKGINAGGMNISNVAPPTQPHHASTRGYVDTQVRYLESKINERYKDGLGASAMAMATALLPPPNTPGRGVFSVASAVVAGQPAFAMGVSVLSENNRLILKGAVASDVRSQVGGGVGASYQW